MSISGLKTNIRYWHRTSSKIPTIGWRGAIHKGKSPCKGVKWVRFQAVMPVMFIKLTDIYVPDSTNTKLKVVNQWEIILKQVRRRTRQSPLIRPPNNMEYRVAWNYWGALHSGTKIGHEHSRWMEEQGMDYLSLMCGLFDWVDSIFSLMGH